MQAVPRTSFGGEGLRQPSTPPPMATVAATAVGMQNGERDEVTEAIRHLLEGGGEMHIDEICRRLEDDFGKRKIRDAVKEMADQGLLYIGSSDDAYMWSG